MSFRLTKKLVHIFLFLPVGYVIFLDGPGKVHAIPPPQLILQTKIISEGDDFATQVLGLPWDMKTGPYPDFATVFQNIDQNTFSISDGLWNIEAETSDTNIWLLWTGIEDTQKVLRLGDHYPIDTGKYYLLSLRLCSGKSDKFNIYWFYDRSPHDDPKNGISKYFDIHPGCHVYSVDLSKTSTFQGAWSGNPIGFRLDPTSYSPTASIQLDWVRLTTGDTSNIVPIQYSNIPPQSTMYFYISKSGCGQEGVLIGTAISESSGTFAWGKTLQPNPTGMTPHPLPESFEPGMYYIYMLENEIGSPICANSQLEIKNAPTLTFQKPSFYSGPDYAYEVVEDPWGMSNSDDVIYSKNFSSLTFNDGILDGVTVNMDSQIHLNIDKNINTNDFKYATFRYHLEGGIGPGDGRVQRFIWWYQGPAIDSVTTQDLVVYDGWHTYSLDLSQALLEPTNYSSSSAQGWTGKPTVFRFDPSEMSTKSNIHLDYLVLTGDEIIKTGDLFDIYYETTPQDGLEVALYYDNDKNPQNGRTLITPYTPAGPFKVFLPLTLTKASGTNTKEINLLTGDHQTWDTNGVPSGTYYISADVSNDLVTTTWYSELPVIIEE